jgi:hypothetical protein
MQSRLLVNIVLLLLVAVLGFFVFTSEDKNTAGVKSLSKIKAASINKIILRHNNRVINFKKSDAHWQLTDPVKIAANDFRIKTILQLLNTVSYAKYEAGSLELDKYGLEQVGTSITFNDHQIDFGIVNPINNYRYIKLNNEVHLIDDHYYPLLSSQTGTLVARNLLPADSKINKLVLPEQTLTLDAHGKWQSTKDISIDAIVETIDHWRNTEAFGVHDYYERDPLGTIEVTTDDNDEPIKFFITDVDPWLIIARPNIKLEYHFNLEFYDSLLRPGAKKKLPDELSDQDLTVSPEEFMKAINE